MVYNNRDDATAADGWRAACANVRHHGQDFPKLPQEVRDAAVLWAGQGFSGMTLTEFLNKMFAGRAHLY